MSALSSETSQLLFRLLRSELNVHQLEVELWKCGIPSQGLKDDELAERLRLALEESMMTNHGDDACLAELRDTELSLLSKFKVRTLRAKLDSRDLGWKATERKYALVARLRTELEKERAEFEQKATEKIKNERKNEDRGSSRSPSPQQTSRGGSPTPPSRALPTSPTRGSPTPPPGVSTTSPSRGSPTSPSGGLNDEQRKRMERNRKRALELKAAAAARKRQNLSRDVAPSPEAKMTMSFLAPSSGSHAGEAAPAPATPTATGLRSPPRNPYASQTKKVQQEIATAASPASVPTTRAPASPPRKPYVTPPPCPRPSSGSVLSVPSPFQRGHVTPTPLARCRRCGGEADQGPCIVWRHSGDVQRERGAPHGVMPDVFRYECCHRLDPQPCFVGRHSPPGHSGAGGPVVECRCGRPAHLRRTKRDGPNLARYFFRCNSPMTRGRCDFFAWADEVLGLPRPRQMRASPDGIKEWECPHADPFGEGDLAEARADAATGGAQQSEEEEGRKKRRLIAALLVHEMCANASGRRGFVQLVLPVEQLICAVMEIWRKNDFTQNLYPMTPQQIARCLGSFEGLEAPTEKECKEVLVEVLRRNPVVSCAVRTESVGGSSVLDLSGLETYLAV